MMNYWLALCVSQSHAESLTELLTGPSDWILPAEFTPVIGAMSEKIIRSAHDYVDFEKNKDFVLQRLNMAISPYRYPSWMPFGFGTLIALERGLVRPPRTVAFSLPSIFPIANLSEFNRLFGPSIREHRVLTVDIDAISICVNKLPAEKTGLAHLPPVEIVHTSFYKDYFTILATYFSSEGPIRQNDFIKSLANQVKISAAVHFQIAADDQSHIIECTGDSKGLVAFAESQVSKYRQ